MYTFSLNHCKGDMSLPADTVGFHYWLQSLSHPRPRFLFHPPPQENWCLSIGRQIFRLLIRAVTCHLAVVFVLNSPVMYFVPGFEITIDHPHTDVVKCSQLVRGRGFLLCSLCPLLFFVPPPVRVGRGVKTMFGLMVTWTHLALLLTFWEVCVCFFPSFFVKGFLWQLCQS